jgi:hypothetical protein
LKSNDGLDVLVERARMLMENARSAATRSGYARDFFDYESFCSAHALTALPLSPPVIAVSLREGLRPPPPGFERKDGPACRRRFLPSRVGKCSVGRTRCCGSSFPYRQNEPFLKASFAADFSLPRKF